VWTAIDGSSLRSDEVDACERVVDLLHRAACCEVAEVDRREARVLKQPEDLGFCVGVVARDEDHALAAGVVWTRDLWVMRQLTITLRDLGVTELSEQALHVAAERTVAEGESIHLLPFAVTVEMVAAAIQGADAYATAYVEDRWPAGGRAGARAGVAGDSLE
jgi:hypothetical protein